VIILSNILNKFAYICHMESTLNILKGTHPGLYLARELNKRKLNQRKLALEINEHPQTLNAVIKQKRSITTALALKLENQLGLSEGFFGYSPDVSRH